MRYEKRHTGCTVVTLTRAIFFTHKYIYIYADADIYVTLKKGKNKSKRLCAVIKINERKKPCAYCF